MIIHVIQVLLYDPLHQWTLSPLKAMNIQRRTEQADETSSNTSAIFEGEQTTSNRNNSSTSKMAERVLLRLQVGLKFLIPTSNNYLSPLSELKCL